MRFETDTGGFNVDITELTIAGWTGRDPAAVQHHIDELANLGIPAPSTTPLFYRIGRELLTQANHVQVLGADSSGEAEPMVLSAQGQIWLGLGSDHTDRKLEAVSVAASKQVCPKPVAAHLWHFDSVAQHLDQIHLTSEIFEDGAWVSYQSGTLAAIRPIQSLIDANPLPDGTAMMCGTLGAIGGVRPANQFRATLRDRVLNREITLAYEATPLPIVS